MIPSLDEGGQHSAHGTGYLFRCRYAGLKRAAYWRGLGFPNLALANAARAKLHEQRRREEAARQFSQFANPEDFADLLAQPKLRRPRARQFYKSRVLGKTAEELLAKPRRRPRRS